ncbi:hypothetical protein CDL12_13604 [Handroanthus impetiginosus]|uniref:EF-hand domain-containing protein n=1 Tax=Handroanthus impetiginosus TaxID=429701 RepID=A0A2G9H8C6_9LAMI|nr:hypothetical protein CDL12_13604 [Handroanthus impetiginosus]
MELALANTISNLLVLLFKSLCGDIENFFSSVQFFLKAYSTKWDHIVWREKQIFCACDNGETFEGEERRYFSGETMNRVGIVCGLEDINDNTSFSEKDLLSMFDEEEPSLEEIKETFGVFDVNNDGFIDASELQRVVRDLGLKEGCELEECKKMIKAYDCNGDGLIDFREFVKIMEKCLC